MFTNDRAQLRSLFFTAWQKQLAQQFLEPLEAQIVNVILQHPEYHAVLNEPDRYRTHDFASENPFLHMALHIALQEQISTDRPAGIALIYQTLCKTKPNHAVEHDMIDCLATIIWEAQHSGMPPDEKGYLESLKRLLS